jgi:hypothetical protein
VFFTSSMSAATASRVAPTATHPGRSGTVAPKLVGPRSMRTAYFIGAYGSSLAQHLPEIAPAEIATGSPRSIVNFLIARPLSGQ